jgi:peptidoglycan hydrolase-like protein with peptidoglycan-binding domain
VRRSTRTAGPRPSAARKGQQTESVSSSLPASSGNWLIDLQQTAGNTAVQRALSSLQDGPPTLRVGSSGPEVAQIQQLLNVLGARPPLATDGTFGNRTRSAVVGFQSTQGLAADGVVGPKTREALESPANGPASTGTVAAPTVGAPAGPTTTGSGPVTFFSTGRPQVSGAGGLQTAEQEGDELLIIARTQFGEGDAAGALPLFKRIYSLPQQPAATMAVTAMFIGECNHQLGNFSEAIKFYQEVLVSGVSTGGDPPILEMAAEGLREARAGEKLGNLRIQSDATPQERAAANATAQQEILAAVAARDPQSSLDHATKAYNQRAASFRRRFEGAVLMGDALQKLKQFDKALDMYQEALGMPVDRGTPPDPLFVGATRDEVRDRQRDARVRQSGKANAPQAAPLSQAEEVALFNGAISKADNGDLQGAADDFARLYAQTNVDSQLRAPVIFNLAVTHQRLQQFDTAISEFEEFLVNPFATSDKIPVARQKIQQCRLKQVGALLQQGGSGDDFVFEGDVLFETGDAKQPGEPVGSTITELSFALKSKHAGTPGSRFAITFVGHASNRFKSAKSNEEADRRNRELSRQRAEKVKELLLAQLPAADVASGVYRSILDAEGDSEAQSLGLDRQDNSWEFRRVRVIAKNA